MTAVLKDSHFERVVDYIKPDSKKRLTLGSVIEQPDSAGYAVYRNDAGQIVLDPVAVIPASELWLFQNKKALEAVRVGLRQSAGGKTVSRGSFAKKYGGVK
ncbi:hypothetical protein [Ereboglobus luteus]|uniref:Uncharacterized protein n=1 Tax=Ereboglobus luteus TaxID=1796921 RepID=A0A2U8E684_9BACT|nr:hypothetical protein [Ereboglobus luteus]AWI10265.1 hypothetical protein CKA38_14290 [Ereboglobus luteus]